MIQEENFLIEFAFGDLQFLCICMIFSVNTFVLVVKYACLGLGSLRICCFYLDKAIKYLTNLAIGYFKRALYCAMCIWWHAPPWCFSAHVTRFKHLFFVFNLQASHLRSNPVNDGISCIAFC